MAPVNDGSRAPGNLLPYDLLDDRYRLELLLGRGGMAAVYRAVDIRLDRHVAIKMLGDAPGADERRFQAEVRTLARFSHPNLVRILDAGDVDGRLYLVMDLIEGTTLAARLHDGPLDHNEVVAIGASIASALAYVHGEGIVHRDIKPANILLDARGGAYLADFGIARLVNTTGMTATGLLLGTPAYLAPEQVRGEDIGAPADVFALGLVLIECLTGERVFNGTLSEIAASRMVREPEIPPGVGARWAPLLRSMTVRDSATRISASGVAVQLSSWREPTAISGASSISGTSIATTALIDQGLSETERIDAAHPTLAGVAVALPLDSDRSDSEAGSRDRHASRRWALLAVAALIVVLFVGVGLGGVLFGSGPASGRRGDPRTNGTSVARSKSTVSSSTTVPTTTTTSTTNPVPSVPSMATAAAQFVSGLVTGATTGNVSPQAGQQLLGQLQPLLFPSQTASADQQVQQFDQLVQTFDLNVANGQITGSVTLASLTQSINALASALGTSVPAPSTSSSSQQPTPTKFKHNHGRGVGR